MTERPIATADSSRLPMCPAKICVVELVPYRQMMLKAMGAPIAHSRRDSSTNSAHAARGDRTAGASRCRAGGGGDERADLVVVVAHRYHHVGRWVLGGGAGGGGGNAARMSRAAPGVGAAGVGDSRARHHRRRVPCIGGDERAGLILAHRYHHVGGGSLGVGVPGEMPGWHGLLVWSRRSV